MKWFGEPWPSATFRAPICDDDAERVPTPVGEICLLCDTSIAAEDRGELFATGQPVHVECGYRNVVGNLTHMQGGCHHIGECNDLDRRPYREQAVEVWRVTVEAAW